MSNPPRRVTPPSDMGDVCRSLTELSEILDEHYSRHQEIFEKTTRRFGYGLIMIGLVALMISALMLKMIMSVEGNMREISREMVQIRETMPAMLYMAKNTQEMTNSMLSLTDSVQSMNKNFLDLNQDMTRINVQLEAMNANMAVMPDMQSNVEAMGLIMHRMQHDTLRMRHSIYGMEQNANNMMMPFRMVNGFLP
ncbi:hypothetical protein [Thioflexithrix psekupsensis]|uniref:Uncharacterized protein n=1 Tax=Thioflexithrix psekupsensis TaxID=1570016 RepID=A0A251X5V6_9GAMM|nr:hypothetical protein [Thioflexithrix psekupsensis]OUD12488.1 hypothetical protein TPSD3_15415 [Thioflexithrix psekupsensis]